MSIMSTEGCTIGHVRADFSAWHRGRKHYAVWALDLDVSSVRPLLRQAQGELQDLLLDGYRRQAHVTLGLCGFVCQEPKAEDDYAPDLFLQQWEQLVALACDPFEIELGALDTFHSVPYLQVHDPKHRLTALRKVLATGPLNASSGPYVPHVTVGLYGDAYPLSDVVQRLAAVRLPKVPVRVTGVSLMAYEAADIGGPLRTLAHFDFSSPHESVAKRPATWWLGAVVAEEWATTEASAGSVESR